MEVYPQWWKLQQPELHLVTTGVWMLLRNTNVHENCAAWTLIERHKDVQESQTFDWGKKKHTFLTLSIQHTVHCTLSLYSISYNVRNSLIKVNISVSFFFNSIGSLIPNWPLAQKCGHDLFIFSCFIWTKLTKSAASCVHNVICNQTVCTEL